jgi:hypothetical protein
MGEFWRATIPSVVRGLVSVEGINRHVHGSTGNLSAYRKKMHGRQSARRLGFFGGMQSLSKMVPFFFRAICDSRVRFA